MDKLVATHVSLGKIGLRLFLLNLYWLFFTVLGGILFGIGPATKVLYQILMTDEEEVKELGELADRGLFRRFFTAWKAAFLPANKLVLPLVLLAAFLMVEIRILAVFNFSRFDFLISVILQVLLFVLVLMMINIFLFKLEAASIRKIYQNSLILVLGQPLFSIGSFVLLAIILSVYYAIPGLCFVFGVSAVAYLEIRYLDRKVA